MSDAVGVAVAKAVTKDLATAIESWGVTPKRSYADWKEDLELKTADGLAVDVVLSTAEQRAEASTRGSIRWLVPVNVCVRKRLGNEAENDETGRLDVEKVDELMLLVQEIYEALFQTRLTTYTKAAWDSVQIVTAPFEEHLRFRQFTAVVRVWFWATKE